MLPSHPEPMDLKQSPKTDRRWARYPTDGAPILVTAGTLQFQAVTVDESIGGLGIETNDPVAIVAGQIVELSYHDVQTRGQITAVVPNPFGGCRISISWEEKERPSENTSQLAFIEFGPVTVVCRPETDCSDQQKSITLWDGKRFEVATHQLAYRTKQSRFIELQTMGKRRDVAARLYGLDTHGSPQAVSERILEFEFGPC
jgi:hypothetical protein